MISKIMCYGGAGFGIQIVIGALIGFCGVDPIVLYMPWAFIGGFLLSPFFEMGGHAMIGPGMILGLLMGIVFYSALLGYLVYAINRFRTSDAYPFK